MHSPVPKIKEILSIEEVIASYIKLEPAGANFKAKCPFHNERTPSFFISPGRGSFYCFGCSAGGDIFTFVQEFEGLDFKGALKLLADKAGVNLKEFTKEEAEAFSEKERLYRVMEAATVFFEGNILHNAPVLSYLKDRGLTEESIKNFRIGFISEDWRLLYSHLTKLKYSEDEIEKAGLIKKTEKGYYDRFRNRIMFPIADSSGRVIAFSGRLFTDDGKSAKYLNSPDTPIFNKSYVLFGLDRGKDSIRKNNFSILVEGQMDLILSHQAGFRNTVASSGTALSDVTMSKENVVSNLGLVRRLSTNIILAYDGDKAGFNASLRAARIALSLGMDVKVANMKAGVDPADLISKEGVDAWRSAVRESKHVIEFLLARVIVDAKRDNRKVGRGVKDMILPFVNSIESKIEQMHFLKKISDATSIPEQALKDDLKKITTQINENVAPSEEQQEVRKFKKDYIEMRLLGIILWQNTLRDSTLDTVSILKEISELLGIPPEEFTKKGDLNREDLIFEAEVFYGKDINIEKDVGELINNLKEETYKEKLLIKMQELRMSEEKKDGARAGILLKEINEINNYIQEIKNGRLKKV
ncbi:MAG: DNA primase [Patescibacteria group bacterium]